MLIPGIKTGPDDFRGRLVLARPKCVEVWYRADRPKLYGELFDALQSEGIPFGLHFWGVTKSGHEPNLGHPMERQESFDLMAAAITVGAEKGASYVNYHTGSRGLCTLDFDRKLFYHDDSFPLLSDEESAALRNDALRSLSKLASGTSVAILVESIPARLQEGDWTAPASRENPLEAHTTSSRGLLDLMKEGLIAYLNDFCHVFSMDYDKDRAALHASFLERTVEFAPYTRAAHINTLTPPYSGTDEHLGILDHEFDIPGVFPTRQELLGLLSMLKRCPHDVWLIGEPSDEHVGNYLALEKLIAEVDGA